MDTVGGEKNEVILHMNALRGRIGKLGGEEGK
jgi:hypothetical protein